MITLFADNVRTENRRSSKGNQLKWLSDGYWYKADYTGYEGLSEYLVSRLLDMSTLREGEYAEYDLEDIAYGKVIYHGARSRVFLFDDWQIITLERLFLNVFGESLQTAISHIEEHENRMRFLVEQVERITGIPDFGVYLSKMLTIDAFFLNEDRHMHNVAVLMNAKGDFMPCPFFDHGAALLSDTTMDYPLTEDIYQLMEAVKSKTICQDFDEQLDLAEKLYGRNIRFSFDRKFVDSLLASVSDQMYETVIKDRVRTIVYEQMRKYGYLFQ